MMHKRIFIYLIFLACIFEECSSQNNSTVPSTPGFKKGVVIDSVVIDNAPGHYYALYLPTNYRPDTLWPVIFMFDPAARGAIAVNTFKNGAEQFGYVLACSDNCKNGPMESNVSDASLMQNDVTKKIAIDPKRLYLAGFSGGSRLAGTLAILQGHVTGLIACGAGLPQLSNNKTLTDSNVVYVATSGVYDMNYMEFRKLQPQLNAYHIKNRIFDFEGIHDWPPPSLATETIGWLELQAMKRGQKNKNTAWLQTFYQQQMDSVNADVKSLNYFTAENDLQYMITDFSGLVNTDDSQKELNDLLANKDAQKQVSDIKSIWQKETADVDEYSKDLQYAIFQEYSKYANDVKPDDWWETLAGSLLKQSKSSDIQKAASAKRITGFFSLACYETGKSLLQNADFIHAQHNYHIWTIMESSNKNAWLGLAEAYSMEDSVSAANAALKKAVANGAQKSDIATNTYFTNLQGTKDFQKLLGELEKQN